MTRTPISAPHPVVRTSVFNSRRSLRRAGFTLVEVLLVLAILGVIAAMVLPNLIGSQQKAMVKQTRVTIGVMEQALKNYAIDHDGEFPQGAGEEIITMLTTAGQDSSGKPTAPYLEKPPLDAWRQPLNYEFPSSKIANGTKPAIWSSGLNKQNEDGGGDDINNWSE